MTRPDSRIFDPNPDQKAKGAGMKLAYVEHLFNTKDGRKALFRVHHTVGPLSPRVEGFGTTDTPKHSDMEFPGIRKVWELAQTDDYTHIGYIHSKGARHPNNPHVADWARYMAYFWRLGPEPGADVTGVNFELSPWPHFSGNFWWASVEHLRKLPEPVRKPPEERLYWEKWIGLAPGRFHSRHQSGVNHYRQPYPKERYAND